MENLAKDTAVRTINGRGRTLMSGLGDAHTHFTWNNGDLGALGELGVEEHTLHTARAAQCYLDSGYTMCYGAASAKERLDVVVRDAINEGKLPGPRYLANGKEMAVPDGDLVPGITAFAKGPLEMRETIRHHIKLGVDNIKLSMSGEQITETRDAQDCYFSDEETAACVDESHRHGVRLCAHARARDSVKQCIRHGVDIIYHASWIDQEGMDMLEKNKSKHIVAPGINWLIGTLYESAAFGYSFEKAEQVGYKKELDVAIKGLKEMHQRGITVLPGGDYGFAWTPHGTYARDLEHFVKLLDFTPMESIIAATAGVAKLFMQEDELGKIKPGYLADCILVDGNPIENISILQEHDKLNIIMINGRIYKASSKEFVKAEQPHAAVPGAKLGNYVSYQVQDGTGRYRIGYFDQPNGMITPLAFPGGTPIDNIYQIIEIGEANVISAGDPFPVLETGLGTLRNMVGHRYKTSHDPEIPINNLSISNGGQGLTALPNGKQLNAKKVGNGPHSMIFIHGLGGDTSFYTPVLNELGLNKEDHSSYTSVVFDLEGHGRSPTKATSKLTIESYAQDVEGLIKALDVPTEQGVTLIAHSMGCLVASLFASQHLDMVRRLILLGPPPCPLPAAGAENSIKRAAAVRAEGMRNVGMTVATAGTSEKTKNSRPLAFTAVQMSLLSQDPEGYAKGCTALASAKDLTSVDFSRIGQSVKTLIISGEEDKISPPAHVQKLGDSMKAQTKILPDVGHWHVFEDVDGVVGAIKSFLA